MPPPARTLVLSTDSGLAGYNTRPTLDEQGWATLLTNLDRIDAVAAEHNVRAVLHPNVGTLIENGDEVQRVLDQDTILTEEPRGEGPVADVHTSAAYLRRVISSSG